MCKFLSDESALPSRSTVPGLTYHIHVGTNHSPVQADRRKRGSFPLDVRSLMTSLAAKPGTLCSAQLRTALDSPLSQAHLE